MGLANWLVAEDPCVKKQLGRLAFVKSPLPYLCETRIRTVMAINRRVPLQHPTTTTTARCRRLNHD